MRQLVIDSAAPTRFHGPFQSVIDEALKLLFRLRLWIVNEYELA